MLNKFTWPSSRLLWFASPCVCKWTPAVKLILWYRQLFVATTHFTGKQQASRTAIVETQLQRSSQTSKVLRRVSTWQPRKHEQKMKTYRADILLTGLCRSLKYMFLDVHCTFKNPPVHLWMKSAKYTRPLVWADPTNQTREKAIVIVWRIHPYKIRVAFHDDLYW